MSLPSSSASKPAVIRLSSAGSPAGSPAAKPRSSSRAERADLGEVAAAELRSQRLGPQPGAMAHRADAGDEETLHQAAGSLVVATQ